MKKDLDKFLEDATRNVNEDRAATKVLLTNLMKTKCINLLANALLEKELPTHLAQPLPYLQAD